MSEKTVNDWKEHWREMPEFVQEDLGPKITVKVHFRNEKDLADFEALIGQKVNGYKVLWFPKAEPRRYADKRWIDEP